MSFSNLSINEILAKFKSEEINSKSLIEYYFQKIEELNPEYNVFLQVRSKEELISEAEKADQERKNGSAKKLLGIPFAVKDSFMAIGTNTTAGDKYLENTKSDYNSTVVQKLLDEGAILLGKTNMDSWGFGSSTENSAYGVTRNPFDKNRVAGGSSGGSAAAVALDMCAFAIGEDTGGSIRMPAAFCGIYGLKPTYGRISRYGCIAYASSLDSIGPMTKNAEDLGIIFEILEGTDNHDMTIENYQLSIINHQFKNSFAYSLDFIPDGISEDVKRIYLETVEKFKKAGFKAIEVKFETFNSVIPTYYITAMSEASTNLSRFQGTRYGKINQELQITNYENGVKSWEDLFIKARSKGFTNEAKRRILLGAFVLSEGYFDAYYKKAQKIRNKIFEEIENALQNTDFILSPVTPSAALKIGSKTTNPVEMYLEDVFTVTANLAGIPALAFPAGKDSEGLPIGMQIMGNKGDDLNLVENLKLIK